MRRPTRIDRLLVLFFFRRHQVTGEQCFLDLFQRALLSLDDEGYREVLRAVSKPLILRRKTPSPNAEPDCFFRRRQ